MWAEVGEVNNDLERYEMTVKVLISGQGNPTKEILKKNISNNEPIEIVMRNATKEELKSVDDYIKDISTPTGKSFYD